MVNYEKLAMKAKLAQDAERLSAERDKEAKASSSAFFAKVKVHIAEEIKKANVELRKKKAGIFEWIHLPTFEEDVFLTYGTDSLCRVGLGVMRNEFKVTAVISGPPNGYEISRKEYFCNDGAPVQNVLFPGVVAFPSYVSYPEEIAIDIISGILRGGFD